MRYLLGINGLGESIFIARNMEIFKINIDINSRFLYNKLYSD